MNESFTPATSKVTLHVPGAVVDSEAQGQLLKSLIEADPKGIVLLPTKHGLIRYDDGWITQTASA